MSGQAASYSKYIAYPEYRDSGVQWLPSFPQHWKVERVKRMLHLRRCLVGSRSAEYQLLSLTLRGIITRDISKGEGKIPESFETYQKVQKSDLVFCLFDMDETPRTVGLSDLDGMITGAYNVYGCLPRCFPGYAGYYFLHLDKFKGLRPFYTGLRKVVRAETFDNIDMPCPPIEEQRTIAAFLDYETARIDSLIDKQQRLIELLKEKRQAVISHAVTKGLNPDAPMKDSGVEWLGQVPEHWAIAQLKFNTLTMQTGPFGSQLHAEDYVDGGIPLVNPAHMSNGNIVPDPQVSVDLDTQERLGRHKLKEGDIIFARRGELGRCAVVKAYEVGWLCGTGSLKATLNERLIPEYAYLLITSDGVIAELSLESKGSTMDNLNTETLGKVRIPVPPISEQREILVYVEDVSGKFKELVEKAEIAIKLMQERRTALISAAVTGKIDLRGWTQPVKEDAA
ncbi:restriction endonuclease subunit S [Shewanella algae]|uniref:restriction endonuclease subunit S n=1 Tax=Shewanella algae TaxID=38313 RepID=UPI001AAC9EF3|nr:restriction endonuclease subunit S [Shewanella algae]QTE85130.1 restriction endonuclease subunit S [Shewanella algae]